MLPTACIKMLFHKLETGCFKATANKRLRTLLVLFCCIFEVPVRKVFFLKPYFHGRKRLVTKNHAEQKKRPWKDVSPPNAIFLDCKALTLLLLIVRINDKRDCSFQGLAGKLRDVILWPAQKVHPTNRHLLVKHSFFTDEKKGNESFLHPCDWQLSHLSKRAGHHRE